MIQCGSPGSPEQFCMVLADELDKLIQTNASFRGTSPFLMIAGVGTDIGVTQEVGADF